MVVLMLKAMNDHLQKIAAMRDPVKALAEFVWNAVDADASEVSVGFGVNALGGIGGIVIKDNGNGITHARAVHDFDCLGDVQASV
jgi:DNA mismatch repair ATPase MutL